ncbi:MAG: hypothetical protein JRF40_06760, partial [Deltaproteobacteria bacterium]|nr:hypothetical protein [Deltaproteobacteria bacterium]
MVSEKSIKLVIMFVFLLCAVMPASSSDTQAAHFKKGSRRLSVMAGSGQTFSNSYVIVGLGAGYYVID